MGLVETRVLVGTSNKSGPLPPGRAGARPELSSRLARGSGKKRLTVSGLCCTSIGVTSAELRAGKTRAGLGNEPGRDRRTRKPVPASPGQRTV